MSPHPTAGNCPTFRIVSGGGETLAERRARTMRGGLQLDFGNLLRQLERTLSWLDGYRIEIAAFSASTLKGARVHVRACSALAHLVREQRQSRGHVVVAGARFEQWEARDPRTGVLIVWEEERDAAGPAYPTPRMPPREGGARA